MNKSRHIKKETLLKALEKSLGVVTIACKKADIPRSTYYKWLKDDEEFRKQVKEIEKKEEVKKVILQKSRLLSLMLKLKKYQTKLRQTEI